jgi:NADH:ubiquinone oxidoreductase subunit
MTITTRLFTLFNGKLVGEDAFGNRYFTEKKSPKQMKSKRWVLYNGLSEPSKIPAQWFGWMHYTTDVLPTETDRQPYAWEKPHLPNLTGTKNAYSPPAKSPVNTGDYEAWIPNK